MSTYELFYNSKNPSVALDIADYSHALEEYLKKSLPNGTKVERADIPKNNGVSLSGLLINERDAKKTVIINPSAYYREYWKGRSIADIGQEILAICRQASDVDGIDFTDYEWIKGYLDLKAVNYEKNSEMLLEVPHIQYLDLAVVPYLRLDKVLNETTTIRICNGHLKLWGVSKEQLFQDAMEAVKQKNPPILRSMIETLEELGAAGGKEDNPLYVLTNCSMSFGASGLFYDGILKACAEQVGKEFYVLPSSLHEMLLISAKNVINPLDLAFTVREVNRTVVPEEEVLSDKMYKYSMEKDILYLFDIEKDESGRDILVTHDCMYIGKLSGSQMLTEKKHFLVDNECEE